MLTAIGATVLALILLDVAITVLSMQSAGPLTSRFLEYSWRLVLAVSPQRAHRALSAGGTAIVAGSVLLWAVLLWAGWSMVFLGSEGGVVDSQTGKPAGIWETIYFAGFTLFTLGLGDFRPSGSVWQVLTAVCVGNGLLVLTASVTYIVPVLSAAAGRRQLAGQIHGIGSTPDGILRFAWNGSDFGALESELDALTPSIILLSQQHLAYPALHYFHSRDARTSLPLRLAALDEAITMVSDAAPSSVAPSAKATEKARQAIGLLLGVLSSAHIRPSPEDPPPPPTDGLRGRVSAEFDWAALRSKLPSHADRRRLLLAWVRNDARQWEEVWS